MATAAFALSSLRFRPLSAAGARPKAGSPQRPSRPNPNLKSRKVSGGPPSYRSASGGGGEATTYTRLPPKDDFSLDPSDVAFSSATSGEIRLRESSVPPLNSSKEKPSGRHRSRSYDKKAKGSMFVEEIEDEDELLTFEPDGKFSLEPSLGFHLRGSGEFRVRQVTNPASNLMNKKLLNSSIFVQDNEGSDDEFLEFESEDDEVIVGYGSTHPEVEASDLDLESESDGELEGYFDGDNKFENGEVKEKGVPAIMRCFDNAKIYVKAGDGGNGVVAFRREKFVPFGGPSGGDGGKGGDVYVEVDGAMNSLLPFRQNVHFRAGRGRHGQGRKQAGAKGEDVVVNVAPGTVIREAFKGGMQGEVLLELMHPGQRALLLPGGRGGRGNASFKSGTNKVPKIAENGEEGAEM
ncbi:hypothetical protein BHM03_00037294 [Ensete ventricosum]|nr:hypothetical protein BHM03_00037294 [Ensete ventricosum]